MDSEDRPKGQAGPVEEPTELESLTVDSPVSSGGFGEGTELGGRYRIWSKLGAGGMGEVWHAFDLKLRVEVALKAMREELFRSERRLDVLRQEVRAARQVVSPNVCRIFDLIEADGRELVSMEYIDGQTLLQLLKERGPLELKEAQDIASQFLAGLEAIHNAGLVHRDVKPENIMVTRSGRVVLMDFGLARQEDSGAGTVSGTPAYMAPEQGAGSKLDARADVYSAGVVLAEMVSPGGIKDLDSRKSLWEAVRSEPPKLPDSPWAPVLKRAVAREPDDRYNSAHTLTRALEEVTLRVEGAEDLNPYPGLASFTEADAEYFFGREAEVEQMWRKLEDTPRLLGLVGPSGAGKTSFLRAGLIPSSGDSWAIVRCTPGNAAIASLATVVAREMAGDPDTVALLPRFDDPDVAVEVLARWGRRRERALLIVDQFEELFTLNPVDEQARFAELLGRLVLEADLRVLLSMRDDFLMQCKLYEPLLPLFESLVPLMPPTGQALRRAAVHPATKCGYRFEDDELIEEMLAEVEGDRGALPMLAFAMARLWEKRDRENGLLTRQAYHDIGGVGGALARHAEETIDRIGSDRVPIVRELFRNLVTAEGTRAAREFDELLSVFSEGDRQPAEEVLRELVDARLLTSYEIQEEDRESARQVEIIHESLLASWPRLVRWRTQDQEGAQLRDELRQAARAWDEHGRHDDRLWTGTAYREFVVWRERYPGGLSETEESFARAMAAFATRRRRRRRLAAAAVLLIALGVGAVTTTLWRRSVAETRRAEAGKLLALGQMQLEADPTAALAYARASLALADTFEARRFAVEVLWRGPVARILPVKRMAGEAGLADESFGLGRRAFSPDGRWLAVVVGKDRDVLLLPSGGGPPRRLPRRPDGNVSLLAFSPRGDVLITGGSGSSMRFWSLPELEEIRTVDLGGLGSTGRIGGGKLFTFTRMDDAGRDEVLRAWSLPEGEPVVLENHPPPWDVGPTGAVVAQGRGRTVLLRPLEPSSGTKERILGEAGDGILDVVLGPRGERVASLDRSGEIRVWSTAQDADGPLHVFQGPRFAFGSTWFDPAGRFVTQTGPNNEFLLWGVESPPGTAPRRVRRRVPSTGSGCSFASGGHWLVTAIEEDMIEFWSLGTPWVRTYRDVFSSVWSMAFTDDRRWLATCPVFLAARLRPLDAEVGSPRELLPPVPCVRLAAHPRRAEILVGSTLGEVVLYPTSGDPSRKLLGRFEGGDWPISSFDLDGRRAVSLPSNLGGIENPEERVLKIWNLESGDEQVYSVAHLSDADWIGSDVGFAHDGSLYASLGNGDRTMRLTLPSAPGGEITAETVVEAGSTWPTLSRDGRFLAVHTGSSSPTDFFQFEELLLFDLAEGTSNRITTHGRRIRRITQIDPTGRIIVSGDNDGIVRAGPISGGEPHLLLGHEGMILGLAISPDGRWIASSSDESVRLWPMPDVTKPPLHTLPHDELMAKLDALTNLRAVRDETTSTGWTLEIGPFPGWETVPEW